MCMHENKAYCFIIDPRECIDSSLRPRLVSVIDV